MDSTVTPCGEARCRRDVRDHETAAGLGRDLHVHLVGTELLQHRAQPLAVVEVRGRPRRARLPLWRGLPCDEVAHEVEQLPRHRCWILRVSPSFSLSLASPIDLAPGLVEVTAGD